VTSHAQGSAEQLTGWTPALAQQPLLAAWALVDRVGQQLLLALDLLTDSGHCRQSSLPTTEPKGALLTGTEQKVARLFTSAVLHIGQVRATGGSPGAA
jgi:hypothetical protein